MKILMLTHRYPYPPDRGDCIRAWGELEYLSRTHDIWLACVDRHQPWPAHLSEARRLCRDVAVVVRSEASSLLRGGLSLLAGSSVTEGYFGDARLTAIVRKWSAQVHFDAVLTFSSAMAPYAELVQGARRVLDMNDVDSHKWRSFAQLESGPKRWFYKIESKRLEAAESRWVRSHDVCLLVNERERRKLVGLFEPKRAAVVRTGVDLKAYTRFAPAPGVARTHTAAGKTKIVGMLGSMSYAPNVRAVEWFGTNVWPRVKASMPDAEWLIVGRSPTRSVRRWAKLPGVTVTGKVIDVRPYLASMRVFACAAQADIGVQTKLIEAMAAARAAVVTPQAAEGIDYGAEPPFLIASTPEAYARAVLRLLRDATLGRRLGARARAVVDSGYRVESQGTLVEQWLAAAPNETPRDSYRPAAFAAAGAVRRPNQSEQQERVRS